MASNIFNSSDYTAIVKRIGNLNSNSPRKWGTININQMLEHCSIQLKLGLGRIDQSTFEGSPIMRTGLGRWLFLYVMPWSKGLPTPSKMNMMENGVSTVDFESEQKKLIDLLEQVQKNPDLRPHPFFGAMTQKDWGRLIFKHLDHHLKQFGC